MDNQLLNDAYARTLQSIDKADTLVAYIRKG
jgi:hypothetical protein